MFTYLVIYKHLKGLEKPKATKVRLRTKGSVCNKTTKGFIFADFSAGPQETLR